eukprot:TRINITY_DN172_c0_g1_i1.p1 TRINITY_DN172_c0_g1~~TRINITY_DN172_c0_g1_i1.p1  ORF type:complete len:450 (-),score=91.49 TRINITY_DN172_c0_g1_i1:148-1458(-)
MKCAVVALLISLAVALAITCDPVPGTPVNKPIGEAKGVFPGRVTWIHDRNATSWDGQSSFWWNDKYVNQRAVDTMFEESLLKLTSQPTSASAWDLLFRYFNQLHHSADRGYVAGDKIAIKINLNGMYGSYDDINANGLSPQYLLSLLTQLIRVANIPQQDICVYDASRWFTGSYFNPVHTAFPRVRLIDTAGLYGREQVQKDDNSYFAFSSADVLGQFSTKLPTCLTQARYAIAVDNVRAHDLAGITLSGKNWFGSVYRPVPGHDCEKAGYWCPETMHDFVNVMNRTMGSYNVLPDLLGSKSLGGKVMVWLADGLYSGADEQPETVPVKFLSQPFNNWWASSVFASQDPIALDSVLFDILRNERNTPFAHNGCVDNYLHESALANNPPSKTVYNPDNTGRLGSLGVHEHWNDPAHRLYSRNMGKSEGIELIQVVKH